MVKEPDFIDSPALLKTDLHSLDVTKNNKNVNRNHVKKQQKSVECKISHNNTHTKINKIVIVSNV